MDELRAVSTALTHTGQDSLVKLKNLIRRREEEKKKCPGNLF